MNYTDFLNIVGEKTENLSATWLTKLSEQFGLNPTNLSSKLFTIFILAILVFFATKITNKVAKLIAMIVGVLFIVSLFYSILWHRKLFK